MGRGLNRVRTSRGISGLVIDGGVRDILALQSRRFPVFARGVSVRGTLKAAVPSVGKAISLSGTQVCSGDLVVADADGVVVIPMHLVEATLQRGEARIRKEAEWMARIGAGETTLDLMGLAAWREMA